MKRNLLLVFFYFLNHLIYSQVGIGTTTPDPSSILDIQAIDRGILVPRIALTDVSLISLDGSSAAAEGLLIFNTNPLTVGGSGIGFYYFNGSTWEQLVPKSKMDQLWTETAGDIERQSGDVYIGNTNGTNNDLYISNALIDWDDPNYRIDPAAISKVNEMEFDDGSPGDPSMRFDDATTGFYSPASDVLGYSINGTERLRVDGAGRLGLNTSTPQARLDVAGTFVLGVNGSQFDGMFSLENDFGNQTLLAGESVTLSLSGTSTVYSISSQAKVNVSFLNDLGPDILIQHCWMEPDAVVFRLYNKATTDVTLPIVAHYIFVW